MMMHPSHLCAPLTLAKQNNTTQHNTGNNLQALPRVITELQELAVVAVQGNPLGQLDPAVAAFVRARTGREGDGR